MSHTKTGGCLIQDNFTIKMNFWDHKIQSPLIADGCLIEIIDNTCLYYRTAFTEKLLWKFICTLDFKCSSSNSPSVKSCSFSVGGSPVNAGQLADCISRAFSRGKEVQRLINETLNTVDRWCYHLKRVRLVSLKTFFICNKISKFVLFNETVENFLFSFFYVCKWIKLLKISCAVCSSYSSNTRWHSDHQ